jgi:hypothetical protein
VNNTSKLIIQREELAEITRRASLYYIGGILSPLSEKDCKENKIFFLMAHLSYTTKRSERRKIRWRTVTKQEYPNGKKLINETTANSSRYYCCLI